MVSEQDPTDEEIVALVATADVFAAIDRHERAEKSSLLDRCVRLHNAGHLNLLTVVSLPAFEALSGWQFFFIQNFFVSAIPRLHTSVEELMEFVVKLVAKGGNDLAANQPNVAFLEWCSLNPSGAIEAIRLARSGNQLAADHLSFALQAQSDLSQARSIAEEFADRRRLTSLTAIGRIPHKHEAERQKTVQLAKRLLDKNLDDEAKGAIFNAVIFTHSIDTVALPTDALEVVRSCLSLPNDFTQYAAALGIGNARRILTDDLVSILLTALEDLNPDHGGTVNHLDFGLGVLVQSGFAMKAIDFVTKLLLTKGNRLQLDRFDSFERALIQGPTDIFHGVLIRWLLNGDRVLCDGFAKLLRKAEREEKPLDIAMAVFMLTDFERLFICRKAIGYFFAQPVVAASILVSTLRSASPNLRLKIRALLFNPLLRSYSGKVVDYLRALLPTDASQPEVKEALALAEKHLAGLRSLGDVKELWPSTQRQNLVQTRWHDQMDAAAKDAENQSVLLKSIKKSVLLYGRQSLTYVADPGGGRRPVQIKMQSHSFGFEMPKQETADPVGLDQMLAIFRAERLKT